MVLSCFCTFMNWGTDHLYFTLIFQVCLNREQPWKIEIVSFAKQRIDLFIVQCEKDDVSLRSEGQACLFPVIKDLGFLSSGFLYCSAIRCLCRQHLALFVYPVETEAWGTGANAGTAIALRKSFVSNPGVSYLLLISWNYSKILH